MQCTVATPLSALTAAPLDAKITECGVERERRSLSASMLATRPSHAETAQARKSRGEYMILQGMILQQRSNIRSEDVSQIAVLAVRSPKVCKCGPLRVTR